MAPVTASDTVQARPKPSPSGTRNHLHLPARPAAHLHATMYRIRASRASPLPTLSSISSLSSSSSPLATTTPPIFTARLPHLALGQQRYKSVQALRPHILLPSTSSLIHHHNNPKNTKPFLNLRNQPAYTRQISSDITVTLSTHQIYTSPHTNNMGVEIPTEQWAQVCKQVGGRKFDLTQHN